MTHPPLEIDLPLLHRRANDEDLHTLQEITLHQQNLTKIGKLLGKFCPKLKILFLQNNHIEKIEGLTRLKEMEYLNIAINQITTIEGLATCESLRKLDLSVNQIYDIKSFGTLDKLELEELHVLGNPCMNYPDAQLYLLNTLPRLRVLDGQECTKTQRLIAASRKDEIEKAITQAQEDHIRTRPVRSNQSNDPLKSKESVNKENVNTNITALTPVSIPPVGKKLQKNTLKVPYILNEHSLRVQFSKFIDSSMLELDVEQDWVTITYQTKQLSLRLEKEVDPKAVRASRVEGTGELVVLFDDSMDCSKRKFSDLQGKSKEHADYLSKMATKGRDLVEICNRKFETAGYEPFENEDEVPPLM